MTTTAFRPPTGRFDMPLPEPLPEMPADTRAGFIALIGAPNAGKSTLINQLVGTKVSIVTHKVQTTRTIVRGVAMHGAAQLVFIDTPASSNPSAGSIALWSTPPGAVRAMPT